LTWADVAGDVDDQGIGLVAILKDDIVEYPHR
jgi:hypothetical protein